ncbi:MAG: SF1B family DNA helicase RecD2 [Bacillota bacterium]
MEIQGIVEDIIYRNESNGYTVGKLYTSDGSITFVGIAPYIQRDQMLLLEGEWIYHNKFGEQFQFDSLESIMPTTTKGIENYLGSGLIPHIGPKTAKRIVEKFGEKSLDIIQYYPERLLEIEGIGKKKLKVIMESFDEQRELREIMVALQEFSITPNQSMKIYREYGADTIKVIQENPYRLADDIHGMGFRTADEIAEKIGLQKDSPYRLQAGLKYVVTRAAGEGHCFLPEGELIEKASGLLQIPPEDLKDPLTALLLSKSLFLVDSADERIVYYMPYHMAENNVAKVLVELSLVEQDEIVSDVDSALDNLEKGQDFTFGKKQREAVKSVIQNGVTVITGGPGTGKTTIINAIISLMEAEKKEILLAAPTGRAAKRITETTGREARTIHRLLEISFQDKNLQFNKNEEEPLDADVVIVDEMSMVDILLMNQLLKAIKPGTRLVLVGDVDQLPSVGAGNVLRDVIESNVIKVVRLDEIFRQGEESMIIVNAHLVNRGEKPMLNMKDKDFFFVYKDNGAEVRETIVQLCMNRLPDFYGFDPIRDIQVLSPMRKGDTGVTALNKALQEAINPPSPQKNEKVFGDELFREGDKVMQIKNNYKAAWVIRRDGHVTEEGEGVFNGDFGYVESIDQDDGIMKVIFDDDREVEYQLSQLDELRLAYATTIHKSQGSEFPAVVIPVFSGPPMLLTRNLLYTAITRARDLVVLVGHHRYLDQMIRNNLITERYSSLDKKIREYLHLLLKMDSEGGSFID